jgi:hypothetical protein
MATPECISRVLVHRPPSPDPRVLVIPFHNVVSYVIDRWRCGVKTNEISVNPLSSVIGRMHFDIMIVILLIKLFFYFPFIWATTHWVVTQDGRITPQVKKKFNHMSPRT